MQIGKDVPWNTAWSAEDKYTIRRCRYANNQIAVHQNYAQGEGRPNFKYPHLIRQRASVIKKLCTVCGEKTEHNKRVMFALGAFKEFNGQTWWLTTEAPVHHICAELAMERCPYLKRLGILPQPFPTLRHKIISQLVGGQEMEKDFGLRIKNGQRVVGHLKIAIPAELIKIGDQ